MKTHILPLTLFCLLLFTGCKDNYGITNEPLTDPVLEIEGVSSERQVLVNRIRQLQRAIQNEVLTPEARLEEIRVLAADIEQWNAQQAVPGIALSYNRTSTDPNPKRPKIPRQPCLLVPCDQFYVSNGWVCFYSGRVCTRGLSICKYTCFHITL